MRTLWPAAFIITASPATGCGGAVPTTSAVTAGLGPLAERFGWMVGSWHQVDGEVVSEEHWLAPAGDVMLGLNRTIEAGQTAAFEYVRLEARAVGICYVASPTGG